MRIDAGPLLTSLIPEEAMGTVPLPKVPEGSILACLLLGLLLAFILARPRS